MDNRPIGVFDSGLGGLTAVRRLHEIMPNESIVYFGDTGRVPYGTRSSETIIKYTRQDVRFLLGHDPKAILVACGTVSSVALDTVARDTPVPLLGVVEPTCRRAAQATKNGRVGVIGTQGTIRSGAYARVLREQNPTLSVLSLPCPLFVPLVENGRVKRGDIVIEAVVREYLQPLLDAGVDTLILGCTHYPLLQQVIGDFMGGGVQLIDSGAAAADALSQCIEPAGSEGETRYFVSDDPDNFDQLADIFLHGMDGKTAELVEISAY